MRKPTKSDGPFRRAQIEPNGATLTKVRDVLPRTYRTYVNYDDCIILEGWDRGAWTLDGHIIPKLAEQGIVAIEIEI